MISEFGKYNIGIDEKQVAQFDTYMKLLQKYNEVMNLTAVSDDEGILKRHFIDSAILVDKILPLVIDKGSKVIDIGTGAGFPGFPVAIVTGCKLLGIDSLNKRIGFLEELIKMADLKDVSVLHARAEELALESKYREKFDFAISRAVASLNMLIELSVGFVKPGGYMIFHKSFEIHDELNQIENELKTLNLELSGNIEYIDPQGVNRRLIVIKKLKSTHKQYPRKFADIKKKPL